MAFPTKYGNEFLVNTTTTGSQQGATTTGLADGRFVVSWSDGSETGADTSDWAVRAQIFNGDGSMAGDEFLVNTTTDRSQSGQTITGLADGGFVVIWTDTSQAVSFRDATLSAQIFNADGSMAGGEFLVDSNETGGQGSFTITTLADGRFVVGWEDDSGFGPPDIRAQIFNTDGSEASGESLVIPTTFGLEVSGPTIAALADGGFVVAWMAFGDPTTGTAIRAQMFNADGSEAGGEFQVSPLFSGYQAYLQPEITGLTDGGFVVSWYDTGFGVTEGGILAQVFNADGSKAGDYFVANTTNNGSHYRPKITGLADGRFVVSWDNDSETGGDISGGAVSAQVFNADGSKAGDEFVVNTTTAGTQRASSVTGLADGRFVVSWSDYSETGGDTSGSAVRAQIFDPREAGVTLDGSVLDDDFVGTMFDDDMSGSSGNDNLAAALGNDTLNGDAGSDRLYGGGGKDELLGGSGKDELFGGSGKDKLFGGGGNDILSGGNGNDKMLGGNGNDKLLGGKGDDRMFGGNGNDKLLGGKGDDTITGGLGRDIMTGGRGADTFVFNTAAETGATNATRDVIRDFTRARGDTIDLSGIDADVTAPGDQAFTFITTSAFTSSEGELRYFQTATKTIIQGDTDGDGISDFEIELNGVITMKVHDFIL